MVADWHFEWHEQVDQKDIFGFTITKLESGRPAAERDIRKAARWAGILNKSLREYIQTNEGQPYAALWTKDQIEAADKQVAADAE